MKNKLRFAAQCLVSVALLGWLFQQDHLRAQVAQVASQAHLGWLALGFLVGGFGQWLGIIRWKIFVKMLDLPVGPREIMRIGWVGALFNNLLLGAVGGDAAKVVWLVARGCPKLPVLMSITMDRISGAIGLIFCSLLFMITRLEWLRKSPVAAGLTSSFLGFLIGSGVLLLLSFFLARSNLAERLPRWAPARGKLLQFLTLYRQFFERQKETSLSVVYSVMMFVSYFFTFYCAARAFQVNIPILNFFSIMPAVDIVSALPVSVAGFGVREHLFTVLLGDLAGVPSARAVLISIAGALLNMVWGLVGLLALPEYRQSAQVIRSNVSNNLSPNDSTV